MSRDGALWLTLSRQVLLHQVTRGDAVQSLSLLRRHLTASGRGACIGWFVDGQRRWIDNAAPQAQAALLAASDVSAVLAGAPAQCSDGHWWLPLDHLSVRVGVLCLGAHDGDTLASFEPLCEAAAAHGPARRRHLHLAMEPWQRRAARHRRRLREARLPGRPFRTHASQLEPPDPPR